MKTKYNLFFVFMLLFTLTACSDVFDLHPKDKVSTDVILSSEAGIRVFMANLYYRAPWQDFTYNRVGEHTGNQNTVGIHPDAQTGNAINSEFNHLIDGGGNFAWWSSRYNLLRDISFLMKEVPENKSLSDSKKTELLAEGHFLKAWCYFDLAKRYGGVSLIKEYQEYTGTADSLRVPRSTEQETWDYVMSEFDQAIAGLPDSRTGADARRATKWIALGMKARAALFAASVAKYTEANDVSFEGTAVSQKLVGLDKSLANNYYQLCIDAAAQIINSGKFNLYKAIPANSAEAQKNLMELFQDPNIAPEECMFIEGYGPQGTSMGHAMDFWYNPYQTRDGSPHPGRMNPTLEFVDCYESYSKEGESSPIVTTVDGNTEDYNGYNPNRKYLHFEHAYDPFLDKDARLWATVILPFTEWKGDTIRIQAGYIQPDGKAVIEADKAQINVDGKIYHTFGAASIEDYSGFDQSNLSCMTRTGFSFKKFLQPTTVSNNSDPGNNTQDWCEMRYAEILLTYAEAVVESGLGDKELAKRCLNATRKRAAFKTDIPLTIENVQRERRVELAFECKRWDDLIRRREFHKYFHNYVQKALDPVLDLRLSHPQFIFIRKNAIRENALSFPERYYYNPIPGIGDNGLVQNPQW